MRLRLNNVCKYFGEKRVLSDFSLEASDKERVGILGPSGGGKTTILNIIAGLVKPDSGIVELPEGRISYVFQENRLLPWLNAEENITATAGCSREKARELLEAMELLDELRSYPGDFSGGMRQRLNIARALAADSWLILMDEPFKGLDTQLRERIIERIDFCCADRTVILVTHDRRECDMMKCQKMIEL